MHQLLFIINYIFLGSALCSYIVNSMFILYLQLQVFSITTAGYIIVSRNKAHCNIVLL